jgi:hypothetical protein
MLAKPPEPTSRVVRVINSTPFKVVKQGILAVSNAADAFSPLKPLTDGLLKLIKILEVRMLIANQFQSTDVLFLQD